MQNISLKDNLHEISKQIVSFEANLQEISNPIL